LRKAQGLPDSDYHSACVRVAFASNQPDALQARPQRVLYVARKPRVRARPLRSDSFTASPLTGRRAHAEPPRLFSFAQTFFPRMRSTSSRRCDRATNSRWLGKGLPDESDRREGLGGIGGLDVDLAPMVFTWCHEILVPICESPCSLCHQNSASFFSSSANAITHRYEQVCSLNHANSRSRPPRVSYKIVNRKKFK